MKFVADTHSLVWYLEDSPRLTASSRLLFEKKAPHRQIVIPSIVMAELLYISRKTSIPVSFQKTFTTLQKDNRFEIYPLTAEIIEKAIPLIQLEMHDALIVATSLHLDIPLMTLDGEIINSGLVEVIKP